MPSSYLQDHYRYQRTVFAWRAAKMLVGAMQGGLRPRVTRLRAEIAGAGPLDDLEERYSDGTVHRWQIKDQGSEFSEAMTQSLLTEARGHIPGVAHLFFRQDINVGTVGSLEALRGLAELVRGQQVLEDALDEHLGRPQRRWLAALQGWLGTHTAAVEVLQHLVVEYGRSEAALADFGREALGLLYEDATAAWDRLRGRVERLTHGFQVLEPETLLREFDDLPQRPPVVARSQLSALRRRMVESTALYLSSHPRPLIGGETVPRQEAEDAVIRFRDGARAVWLEGAAGSGKSAVVRQILEQLDRDGWPTLALRVDALKTDAPELQAGSPQDPVLLLETVSKFEQSLALLVVDQLDAVSELSGRQMELFAPVRRMLERALASTSVRVLFVCRSNVLGGDHRLRELRDESKAATVAVSPLTPDELDPALRRIGLDPATVEDRHRVLLSVPLHLYLFQTVLSQLRTRALDRGVVGLFDAFWDTQRRGLKGSAISERQWRTAIKLLCQAMSDAQRLDCAMSVLERNGLSQALDRLVADGLVMREQRRVRFFHQSFYDFAWVRTCLDDGRLVDWLRSSPQGWFQRPQLQQAILVRRGDDHEAYAHDLDALLRAPDVRAHMKQVAQRTLHLLITDPSPQEGRVVRGLIGDPDEDMQQFGWSCVWGQRGWLDELQRDRMLLRWWLGTDTRIARIAGRFLESVAVKSPEQVADVLGQGLDQGRSGVAAVARFFGGFYWPPPGPDMARVATRLIDLGGLDELQEGRPMLLVGALKWALGRRGQKGSSPDLALAALARIPQASLAENPYEALRLDDGWPIEQFEAIPSEDVEARLLPAILDVTRRAAASGGGPTLDPLYRSVAYGRTYASDVGTLAVHVLRRALERKARLDPEGAQKQAINLLDESSLTMRFIATSVLAVVVETEPDRGADILESALARSSPRPLTGWSLMDKAVLSLLARSAPALSDELLLALEQWALDPGVVADPAYPEAALRARADWLRALGQERLSEAGRALLASAAPEGGAPTPTPEAPAHDPERPRMNVLMSAVVSPIDVETAGELTDAAWLEAFATHARDDRAPDSFTVGGALELASVLEKVAQPQVDRFLALACAAPADVNPHYLAAILTTLRDESVTHTQARGDAAETLLARLMSPACERVWWRTLDVLQKRPAWPWSTRVLDWVVSLVTGDADDGMSQYLQHRRQDQTDAVMFGTLNSVRGAAIEAVGLLLHADFDRLPRLLPAIERGVHDPAVTIRAGTALSCLVLLGPDPERRVTSLRWFLDIVSHPDDALLASRWVVEYLHHRIVFDWSSLQAVVLRMLESSEGQVANIGGKFAIIALMSPAPAPPGARELADHALKHANPAVRAGAVELLGDHVDEGLAPEPFSWLCDAFQDPDETVRRASCRWLYEVEQRDLAQHEELARALVASPAFEEGAFGLISALEKADARLPDLLLHTSQALCRIAVARGDTTMQSRLGAELTRLPTLIVRGLRELEPQDPSLPAWLDVLDEVVRLQVHGLDRELQAFDR